MSCDVVCFFATDVSLHHVQQLRISFVQLAYPTHVIVVCNLELCQVRISFSHWSVVVWRHSDVGLFISWVVITCGSRAEYYCVCLPLNLHPLVNPGVFQWLWYSVHVHVDSIMLHSLFLLAAYLVSRFLVTHYDAYLPCTTNLLGLACKIALFC